MPAVYLDWGLPTQRALGKVTPQTLAGHDFAAPGQPRRLSFRRCAGRFGGGARRYAEANAMRPSFAPARQSELHITVFSESKLIMKTCLSSVAIGLLLLSSSAEATSICRWVNDSGRTQIAEVVPDKYRKIAVCTDSQKYELSPEQRRAAEQRVADDRARERKAAAKPPSDRASSASPQARAASQAGARRPTEVVTADTDCTTWWRIYDESVECFGPYRTTRGATKLEGFDRCNVVASPESKCGPRSR